MSLGPQCWRCKKRRLRCDSSHPACRKCGQANVECPGYGEKRPIAWRTPLVLTEKGVARVRQPEPRHETASASVMGIICRSPRTIGSELELRLTADAIEYYNLNVAPDLVPYVTQQSPYQISTAEVGDLAEFVRKSYISIAALHRLVRAKPTAMETVAGVGNHGVSRSVVPARGGSDLLASEAFDLSQMIAKGDFKSAHFASQAAAVKALSEELNQHYPFSNGGPEILLGIMLMLSSQIQSSAYAPWQTHIHGAWGLVSARGGIEAMVKKNGEFCRMMQQIAVVDIFGMSTHRMTAPSAKTVLSRHEAYAFLFDEATIHILNPWTLMPNSLVKTLNRINMLRAQNVLLPSERLLTEGLSAVLGSLEKASPESWAAEVTKNTTLWLSPRQLSDDEETKAAWRALMTAFLNATILYAINSLAGMGGTPARAVSVTGRCVSALIGREMTAYYALLASVRFLFDQRASQQHRQTRHGKSAGTHASSGGLLHKFAIWPMVIGGIQAALVHQDKETMGYLCWGMQSIGEELGTVSMIDGSRLVEKLWLLRNEGQELKCWDDLFDGAPLFLM